MKRASIVMLSVVLSGAAWAKDLVIPIHMVSEEGVGKEIGKITASASKHGVILRPELEGLATGLHGFHLHENPACEAAAKDGSNVAALAAGGHYDPENAGVHAGPYANGGHLGDLPPLYVDEKGMATVPMLAPRLELGQLRGHALVIHAGGDNFADEPEKLGGGGGRIACGVVPGE